MNLEGRLLGNRYEIIKKIGMGGMATVYKARCRVLNRYVAIKILRDEFTTDAEFIKRFECEAQAAASLSHPNIVGIYDVANEGDLYYIVMELIQGKTLKEIINSDGVLPWKWSINVAIQIASALEVAHKNNIVHRDIKPHNIIITEDGVAKVTDFGIAKAVSNSTITAFGSTIGSVHYFSPEHAKGGFTDAKSDLYSLGVVMYEMLTGRVPFDADTPVSIALKHIQEEPIEPIRLNPNIPISVNNVIMKAMKKDPSQRYTSATEMLRDLRETIKNPTGDFVKETDINDVPTQRIQTIDTEKLENDTRKKENKIAAFFKKHKVLRVILIVVLSIAIFFAALFGAYFGINANRPKEVPIPDLVGKSQEVAQTTLKELNVVYELKEEVHDDEIPAGYIISQEPPFQENLTILEGSTISVVVSKGQKIVVVPKVVGDKIEDAEKELSELGLKVSIEEEYNEKVEAGIVTKQSIEEGEEVAGNTEIKLTVSKGVKMVKVPNLLGKTEEEAKKEIENAGLKLNTVRTETDTTKENGVVIRQDIEDGKEVEEKTEITITINVLPQIKKGTVNINVQSFTGYTAIIDDVTGEVTNKPNNVEVMVKVTSQGSEDTVYRQQHSEDTKNVGIEIEGVGNVTVKVYIGGVLEKTELLNLNQENPILTVEK